MSDVAAFERRFRERLQQACDLRTIDWALNESAIKSFARSYQRVGEALHDPLLAQLHDPLLAQLLPLAIDWPA